MLPESPIEDTLSEEARPVFERFNDLQKRGNVSESFLFFTDPHLLGAGDTFSQETKEHLLASFSVAKELYDVLNLSFCICGGDWLNSGDPQTQAEEKLLFADKHMKSIFKRYYKMMGNHDTNYQGVVSVDNDKRGDLPRDFVDKQYFSETGSAYYSFEGANFVFFILDSGLDWDKTIDDYRSEQLLWFAEQIESCKSKHIVIGIHMFYDNTGITPMSEALLSICDAYNNKEKLSFFGSDYNYTNTEGKIQLILSGHMHSDSVEYVGRFNLPVVRTHCFIQDADGIFDICMFDFQEGLLHMVRIGQGIDRTILLS